MQSQAKKLDEIMKTELLSTLPADEIGTVRNYLIFALTVIQ